MKITRISSIALTLALAGSLAACQQAKAPEAQETSAVETAPDAKPGLAVTDGKLVLPVIAGRPGAVYFTITNSGDKPATIVSAHIEGAATSEIHETKGGSMTAKKDIEIPAGGTVQFAPAGLHVMAFELAETIANGGTTELTVSFADGDKISAPLAISTMGSDAAAHPAEQNHDHHEGMKH